MMKIHDLITLTEISDGDKILVDKNLILKLIDAVSIMKKQVDGRDFFLRNKLSDLSEEQRDKLSKSVVKDGEDLLKIIQEIFYDAE
jgi:hypothetical protein